MYTLKNANGMMIRSAADHDVMKGNIDGMREEKPDGWTGLTKEKRKWVANKRDDE
jgi:hypothetical protein